jgi:hypothetical protein
VESIKKYAQHKMMRFVHMPSTFGDPNKVSGGRVSRTVAAQSLDVAHFLHQVPRSRYLLFMEDDFELCPNGLQAIHHAIHKSNHRYGSDGWVAIRMSFGLNGIIFRNDNDIVSVFASYLEEHATRRPPDHLFTEFAAKETDQSKRLVGARTVVGYRYNAFHHLGSVSTLRDIPHWSFPGCWVELLVPTVFEVEAFDKKQCPLDDIWPCCTENAKWPGCSGNNANLYPWIRWSPDKVAI